MFKDSQGSNYPPKKSYQLKAPSYTFGLRPKNRQKNLSLGPGAYNPKMLDRVPAAILSATQKLSIPRISPGPADYNVSFYVGKNDPRAVIGKAEQKQHSSVGPGPAAYNIKVPHKNMPHYSFGQSDRDIEKQRSQSVVGPGSYNLPATLKTDQGFNLSPRLKQLQSQNFPGPGTYNPQESQIFRNEPRTKIGNESKMSSQSNSFDVGPGYYSNNYQFIQLKDPAYSIGNSKRQFIKINNNPGPGDYQIKQNSQSGPKYSFMQKYSERIDLIPGPQDYSLDLSFIKTRASSFKIGSSKRKPINSDNNVHTPVRGPGHYRLNYKDSVQNYVFGRDMRSFQRRQQTSPGPGSYNIQPLFPS